MGTLDSLFNRARDVANDLGQKANDVVEVSKLKLTVVSLGSDIDKVYQKLGLMVYEMAKAGSENRELVDGCVAEIDALKCKLDEVNEKIDALKNVRRCDGCGNTVDASAQFCPMCGSLIHHPEPTADYEPSPVPEETSGEAPAQETVNASAPEEAAQAEETVSEGVPEEAAQAEETVSEGVPEKAAQAEETVSEGVPEKTAQAEESGEAVQKPEEKNIPQS